MIINIVFILFDLLAIIMCAKASTLVDFFESFFFYIYIFGDALKNIFFSLFLAFYGLRLIMKFYRYSTIELNERICDSNNILQRQHSVFSTALSRLTITLIIASVCFVTRLIMLILKSIALNSNDTITTSAFPLFGFYWFCFSDFIPRMLPSITFVLLMRSKRRGIKRELDTSLQKGTINSRHSHGHRFIYVGDEEEYDEDEHESDFFSGDEDEDSDTESISLFDPPPGSFIDDKSYSTSPFVGGHNSNISFGSVDLSRSNEEYNYKEESDDDAEEGGSQARKHVISSSSGMKRLSANEVLKERRRLQHNSAEVSLTSFRNLSGGGDL